MISFLLPLPIAGLGAAAHRRPGRGLGGREGERWVRWMPQAAFKERSM